VTNIKYVKVINDPLLRRQLHAIIRVMRNVIQMHGLLKHQLQEATKAGALDEVKRYRASLHTVTGMASACQQLYIEIRRRRRELQRAKSLLTMTA
jgi:hypothetical protein